MEGKIMKKASRFFHPDWSVFLGVAAWAVIGSLGSAVVVRAQSPSEPVGTEAGDPLRWPAVTRECRPWAYHWWLGSAVDKDNLAREYARYREGGLGGVHIVPIYGAKGAEARYRDYLSKDWMEMLDFAVREADRLDMGVDMTTGTGWNFGGPHVLPRHGCASVTIQTATLDRGGALRVKLDRDFVQAVVAVSSNGNRVDLLTKSRADGSLEWEAGDTAWNVITLAIKPTGRRVKRAAPGGEGLMINPLHDEAMRSYLEPSSTAFKSYSGARPRSMYYDSYEYDTRWSPNLLARFEQRRGYRLQDHLHELVSSQDSDRAARIRSDFRETVSDMLIEEATPLWVRWCRERGIRTRYQAHGSPANLLDLYALADIPETEMFGRGDRDPLVSRFDERFAEGDREPLICKFASSAAHVAGRKLVAAETCTWMAEHFCETLEEAKCFVDRMFLSGVNHVFYHGCVYSPDDATWPGWLFYASTQMNPRSSIWRDVPALNEYIARCQAILQSGEPDNDLLVYWPIHDAWHSPPRDRNDALSLLSCSVHRRDWLVGQPLHATATTLWTRGWGFDYVSDRQLAKAEVRDRAIVVPGGSYRAIVVPPIERMPLPTLTKLIALAESGGTVIFSGALPKDVPGMTELAQRRAALQQLVAKLSFKAAGGEESLREGVIGKGRIRKGDLEAALRESQIARERCVDHPGLLLVRRKYEFGRHYFLANQGTTLCDGWVGLSVSARSVVVMDPLSGRTGVAEMRGAADGTVEVRLRIEPGHSLILRTLEHRAVEGPKWTCHRPSKAAAEIAGPWRVEFLQGGPVLPRPYEARQLTSWTENGDPETRRFAGTAVYRTKFTVSGQGPWILDLGAVRHSARVRVNGRQLGTLIMHPYCLELTDVKSGDNALEVEVTNLSANRIRDLDVRQVPWRIFRDANVVNIRYRPFDASPWPVMESGLIGPVTLRGAWH